MAGSRHRLNCFCMRRPLLAMYGRDGSGRPYVHIRVFKQNRVYGEFIAYGGEVKIKCRECIRWHTIVFRQSADTRAELRETQPPPEVDGPARMVETAREVAP